MKIKESSWHYRLLSLFDVNHSQSLCGYFWQVVVALLVKAPASLLVVGFLAGLLIFWFSLPILAFFEVGNIGNEGYTFIAFWAFLAVTLLEDKYSFIYNWNERRENRNSEKQYKEKEERQPNLFFEWLKAKKEKVCPMLEFVREPKDE